MQQARMQTSAYNRPPVQPSFADGHIYNVHVNWLNCLKFDLIHKLHPAEVSASLSSSVHFIIINPLDVEFFFAKLV